MPEAKQSLADQIEEHIAEKVAAVDANPFQRDTEFLETMLPLMELFGKYFDAEVHGLEALPDDVPMLLVGNHSGGLFVPDTPVLIAAWYRERGLDSPLLGLAFDGMFGVPGMEKLMRRIGEIPANHENAGKALDSGASVLVYPGGAREAFRSLRDRNRILFNGHKGFIKLALRKGVRVVPVVSHGGQHTTIVLDSGESMASRIGLDRFKMTVAPLMLQVPWGLSIPIAPGVPLPAKIKIEVGEPIDWSHYGAEGADDPDIVDACYEEITGRMQATLDRLARETPYPLVDRMMSLVPSWLKAGWGEESNQESPVEADDESLETPADPVATEAEPARRRGSAS